MNRFFSLFVRYLTFAMALAGFIGISMVVMRIHASDTKVLPPPPVAPPDKPYAVTIAATGILEALSENVSLGVPVPGLVVKVNVGVNDPVEEGQPLFQIDDRDLQAQMLRLNAAVDVSKAMLEVQKASLAKSQDMLDRVKLVPDSRALSVDEIRARENEVAINRAQVLAGEAELKAAIADVRQTEILLGRLVVRAPRRGVILQVNIRAGEYASNGTGSALMVLGDVKRLQVRADVDEQNATRILLSKPGVAYVKGDTKRPIPLKFVRVEPYVIPKVSLTGASTERVDTRVLQVIFSLDRPEGTPMYVGQQVDVYIDGTPTGG